LPVAPSAIRFDKLVEQKGDVSRSEATGDLIRDNLVQRAWSESGSS
jgi:metal-responsive CopG/Arc/MetJ family transcriptional regulator